MLNNKGLVVSSVLYTLLIAFLLFLGITLANFSSSTKIVSSATKDLVDGEGLVAKQVYEFYTKENFKDQSIFDETKHVCGSSLGNFKWYQKLEKNEVGQVISSTAVDSNTIVRIYSRYGTTYWPRDFEPTGKSKTNRLEIVSCKKNDISVSVSECAVDKVINYIESNITNFVVMEIEDTALNEKTEVTVSNVCP